MISTSKKLFSRKCGVYLWLPRLAFAKLHELRTSGLAVDSSKFAENQEAIFVSLTGRRHMLMYAFWKTA